MFSFFKKRKCASACGWVVSDVGCLRENNEDNFVLGSYWNSVSGPRSEYSVTQEGWLLAAVFDGMGGGERGEEASRMAAECFLEVARQMREDPSREEVNQLVRSAFLDANRRIVKLQEQCSVFGTTGTVLCMKDGQFKLYHLGDSRAYLLSAGKLTQLTRDQTLAQMKIDVGLYDITDPRAETEKHQLTEYIGCDSGCTSLRPVESEWQPLKTGDALLLCSDGLYDMCPDKMLPGILRDSRSREEAVRNLVEAAKDAGGEDNITCILIQKN